MAYMADLNSFSPIRYEDRHPPSNNEPRGILTNKTNTISANQYQPQKQNQTLAIQPEAAVINQYQPPKYNHPTPSQPPPPTAAVNQKPVRARSASVHSQKSVGDATDDERNQNPLLREHPRKTIVAFGRTTKVDETIKNIRPTTLPYKPPVGSTKDILDLRKTVEHQAFQLQSQQDEIQQLKATIEGQQEKYRFLLDSNSKLWARFDKLEKQISTNNSNANYNHVMLKEKAKEEDIIHSNIDKHIPKDSIAVKKYKEKNAVETEKPQRNNNNEERQIVPAQSIKLASEIDAVSAVERYLYANPNRAKDIEKIAKGLQKKQRKSDDDESEDDRKKMDNGRGDHRRGHHHHHHKNDKNDIVEKITLERKIYKRHNIHDYLSSTIDDSLHKLGISTIQDRKQNHHHQQNNRRRSPTTPTIHEVTSSEASSFESDDFVEEPRRHRQSPERPLRRRQDGRRYDSDRENRQLSPTIEATNMPDQFDDDDDLSSDNETPRPQPRRERRQRVAERLQNRRH